MSMTQTKHKVKIETDNLYVIHSTLTNNFFYVRATVQISGCTCNNFLIF